MARYEDLTEAEQDAAQEWQQAHRDRPSVEAPGCEMDGYIETADTERYWHCEELATAIITLDGKPVKVCQRHAEDWTSQP